MSGDDQRTRDRNRESEGSEQAGEGDDLEALAGGLSATDAAADMDEELNLGALAGTRNRANSLAPDGEARLRASRSMIPPADAPPKPMPSADIAGAPVTPARDSPAMRGAGWLMPLLVGLGIGVGVAGALFGLLASRTPPPVAPASSLAVLERAPASPVAPAPVSAAPPSMPPATLAAVAEPSVAEPSVAEEPAAAEPATPALTGRAAQHSVGAPTARRGPAMGPEAAGTATAAAASDAPVLSLRPAAEPAPSEAAPEQSPQAPAKGSSMDDLLDQALAPSARRAELERRQAAALEQETLAQTPSREAVTKAMSVLLPAIHGCAMGQTGMATAVIVVRADGRVADAGVKGAPFVGTASGRCMEGVIRRAQFPRFKQPIFRITFPFAIQ